MKRLFKSKPVLSLAATFALLLTLTLSIIATARVHALAATQEILSVPFVNGPNGKTTANSYTGNVAIYVSGTGQAAGAAFSDAFYIFTDGSGNPITPVHNPAFGLCINGQPVDNFLPVIPPFSGSSDHPYQFTITAPGGQLTFGVCDTFTVDNTGSFTITVVSQSQLPSAHHKAQEICSQFLPESACIVILSEVDPATQQAQLQITKQILQGVGQAAHDAICNNPGRAIIFGPNKPLADFFCGPKG